MVWLMRDALCIVYLAFGKQKQDKIAFIKA